MLSHAIFSNPIAKRVATHVSTRWLASARLPNGYGTEPASWEWYDGVPPHIGWWNTQLEIVYAWRWWDGVRWSRAVAPTLTADEAAARVMSPNSNAPAWVQKQIQWNHYWPEGARVPRIPPADDASNVGAES